MFRISDFRIIAAVAVSLSLGAGLTLGFASGSDHDERLEPLQSPSSMQSEDALLARDFASEEALVEAARSRLEGTTNTFVLPASVPAGFQLAAVVVDPRMSPLAGDTGLVDTEVHYERHDDDGRSLISIREMIGNVSVDGPYATPLQVVPDVTVDNGQLFSASITAPDGVPPGKGYLLKAGDRNFRIMATGMSVPTDDELIEMITSLVN